LKDAVLSDLQSDKAKNNHDPRRAMWTEITVAFCTVVAYSVVDLSPVTFLEEISKISRM
jgi:hypothetical protein